MTGLAFKQEVAAPVQEHMGTCYCMLMKRSYGILNSIRSGNLLCKPGWIRLSVHPTMTNTEIDFIMDAIELTASDFKEWVKDYTYNAASNEYSFRGIEANEQCRVEDWFNVSRQSALYFKN